MAVYCYILIYSLMCLTSTVASIKDTIHFNKYIRNSVTDETFYYTFDWLLKVSLRQCIDACKTTKACEYINYEVLHHKCGLVRSKQTIDYVQVIEPIETKLGAVFGKKSEWKQDNVKNCESCPSIGNCDHTTGGDNSICRNSGCDLTTDKEVKGNMISSGSIVIQNCKPGYITLPIQTSHSKNQLICSANGTWLPSLGCFEGDIATRNGSYYYLTAPMTWYIAKSFCERYSGHLMIINSETEQRFVESLIVGDADNVTWIGLNDLQTDGIYQWPDGTQSNYFYWLPTHPDDARGDCIQIMRSTFGYGWATSSCYFERQGICEFDSF